MCVCLCVCWLVVVPGYLHDNYLSSSVIILTSELHNGSKWQATGTKSTNSSGHTAWDAPSGSQRDRASRSASRRQEPTPAFKCLVTSERSRVKRPARFACSAKKLASEPHKTWGSRLKIQQYVINWQQTIPQGLTWQWRRWNDISMSYYTILSDLLLVSKPNQAASVRWRSGAPVSAKLQQGVVFCEQWYIHCFGGRSRPI